MFRGPRPLRGQINKCKHFNGLINEQCNAGVAYQDVMGRTASSTITYPCFREELGCSTQCAQAVYPTEEELDKREQEINAHVLAFVTELHEGKTCPRCHKPIEKREQIGQSIYAYPCGCRLGMGSLKKEGEGEDIYGD